MITIPTLSFCITCKNRLHQILQTLGKNLDDNRLHHEWIEFILVDFGSTDGLRNWVTTNFSNDIKSGYLKYYYTNYLTCWHASIAKNTAHWCAKNDIVVNLDCDNFTGYLGGQFVIQQFLKNSDIICHQFSGNLPDGSYGRISVLRKYFNLIGGYDEHFEPMGFQDVDLINRLRRIGLDYRIYSKNRYSASIPNSKEESILYTNSKNDYSTMNDLNYQMSERNINEGRIIANDGIFGIRHDLIDHTDCLSHFVNR